MPRLGNPLVYNLLDVADGLLEQGGTANTRKAAWRRAVSTSYYAVFHALCFICADEMVGWSKAGELEPIYRSVEHGVTKKRLASKDAAMIGSRLREVGAAFTSLQEKRNLADYAPPALPVSRDETIASVALARRTVEAIETLDAQQQLKLAILLIAYRRS